MESDEEIATTKTDSVSNFDEEYKTEISRTRYLDKFPSYVVAFSLKETYDDLVTAQKMICNKRSPQERSPQESTNSITPTNSLKTFDNELPEKSNQNLDPLKIEAEFTDKNNPLDSTDSFNSMTPTNSFKYLSNDDISDASLVTVENIVIDLSGDGNDLIDEPLKEVNDDYYKDKELFKLEPTEVKESNANPGNKELTDIIPKTYNKYPTNDELTAITSQTDKFLEIEKEGRVTNDEPQAIFKATKSNRKEKKRKVSKRKSKRVNSKQKKFKYKNPKKVIDTRLEKYYQKRTFVDADQIQRELYSDEVSTFVSRTRILQKILGRENLLADNEFTTFIDDVGLNEYDNDSLNSSLSTAKKSMIRISSQDTLTRKNSETSSRNKEATNVETMESVINISKENIPYKSEIINVAVAVAYNRSKVKTRNETLKVPSQDKFMHLGSLTSSDTITTPIGNLTSNTPIDINDYKAVTIEVSENTLVNKNSSFGGCSDDFVIARTSSDFTKSSDESTFTLKNDTETIVNVDNAVLSSNEQEQKQKLLETVINLGIYPEMTPSTSSDTPNEYDYNDVIVTGTLNKKCPNSKGDNEENILTKNILKKVVNQQNNKPIKIINLPNQAEIKALLKETDLPQMKCTEETRHPSHMPEMWEKLVMTLDLAVKRLEDTLAEKIIKELKKAFIQLIPKEITQDKDVEKHQETLKLDAEQGEQCDLVKSTVIDLIMQKLSTDGPKIIEPIAVKSLPQKTKLFEEFEVLKPPDRSLEVAEKDTIIVSTVTYSNEVCNCSRLRLLFSGPLNFIRENMFVITTVPTFFIVLLCVYGLILLLMKPW